MKNITFLLISLFITLQSFSQEEKIIELYGTVKNDSLQPLPFVNVLITNRNTGVISHLDGSFFLSVQAKDVLLFSSVGYKRKIFVIPDTIKNEKLTMSFIMELDTILLNVATVMPWKTYEQFKLAVLNMKRDDRNEVNARRNLELMVAQALSPEYMGTMGAIENYRYMMNQYANRAYYAGQQMPNNFLNPFAWARFFELINKNRERKKKKEID